MLHLVLLATFGTSEFVPVTGHSACNFSESGPSESGSTQAGPSGSGPSESGPSGPSESGPSESHLLHYD